MKKRIIVLVLMIFLLFSLTSCLSTFRSARGLKKDEISVTFNAPTSGNIRYGIHENIELETSYEGANELLGFDIFFHFHPKPLDLGLGVAYTISDNENVDETSIFFILSKGFFNQKFNPYFSVSYIFPKTDLNQYSNPLFTTGFEWDIWENDKSKITLTPQVYWGRKMSHGDLHISNFPATTIGLGFNYKF